MNINERIDIIKKSAILSGNQKLLRALQAVKTEQQKERLLNYCSKGFYKEEKGADVSGIVYGLFLTAVLVVFVLARS